MRKSRNPNNSESQRQCSDCKTVYPLTGMYFWKNSLNCFGFSYHCKACTNKRKTAWHFKRKYGLSMAELEMKKAQQSNRCAICFQPADVLCVDHNKRTRQIREMLCKKCNQGIGLFDENLAFLESAISYLKKHNLSKNTRQAVLSLPEDIV